MRRRRHNAKQPSIDRYRRSRGSLMLETIQLTGFIASGRVHVVDRLYGQLQVLSDMSAAEKASNIQ